MPLVHLYERLSCTTHNNRWNYVFTVALHLRFSSLTSLVIDSHIRKKQKTKGSSLSVCIASYTCHFFCSLLLVHFSSCAFLTLVIDKEEAKRLLATQAICYIFLHTCLVWILFLPTQCSVNVLWSCRVMYFFDWLWFHASSSISPHFCGLAYFDLPQIWW